MNETMGTVPSRRARALLAMALGGAVAGPGWAGPEGAPEPWIPPNYTQVGFQELVPKLGYGDEVQGLLQGRQGRIARALGRLGEPVDEAVPVDPPADLAGAGTPPPGPLLGPDEFARQTEELLEAVARFGEPGAAPDLPLDQEFEVVPEVVPEDEGELPPGGEVLADLDGYLQGAGLGTRVRVDQTVTVGILESDYTSVADGRTTTSSRYVKHLLEVNRGVGRRQDLKIVNELTLDQVRDREVLDVLFTRQVQREGILEAQGTLTVHNQKDGEVEPDYLTRELALTARRDALDGLSWSMRVYQRDQDYDVTDTFYLDNESGSYQLGARISQEGLDLEGRHTLERDRYPMGPTSDVDRILSEFTGYTELEGTGLAYYSLYQREGVLRPLDLEPYRLWYNEVSLTRPVGTKVNVELKRTKQSRSVDVPSFFLYDSVELGRSLRVTAQFTPTLDGALGFRAVSTRNRPATFLVNAAADDKTTEDLELYLHHGGRRVDLGVTAYVGDTDHASGQTEAFADFDRSGVAVSAGYTLSPRARLDLSYSRDQESYPSFPINDNDSRSFGVAGSLAF